MKAVSKQECCHLIDKWFDEFICEWSGIGFPMYNPWLASISDHSDPETTEKVLKEIEQRHGVDLLMFDGNEPLILLAFFVLTEEDAQ